MEKQISVNVEKDYEIWISQKIQKRKVLEVLVPLQTLYKIYGDIGFLE